MKSEEDKYIILLESATDSCSVALSNGDYLLSEKYASIPKAHDSLMATMVRDILNENNISAKECDAVAISQGPGSYMGLRIASSLAKGIAFGANIKLIGISTLSVIVQCAIDNNLIESDTHIVVPMIDAGRMEVYTANYSPCGEPLEEISAKILTEESYIDELKKGKVLFTGNGCNKYRDFLREKAADNPIVDNALNNATFIEQLPHASGLRVAAFRALKENKTESIAYFQPFYLKDFIPGKPKKLL